MLTVLCLHGSYSHFGIHFRDLLDRSGFPESKKEYKMIDLFVIIISIIVHWVSVNRENKRYEYETLQRTLQSINDR